MFASYKTILLVIALLIPAPAWPLNPVPIVMGGLTIMRTINYFSNKDSDDDLPDPNSDSVDNLPLHVGSIFDCINVFRQEHQINLLCWNSYLMAAAQEHAPDLTTMTFLRHVGADGSTTEDRIRKRGVRFTRQKEINLRAGSIDDACTTLTNNHNFYEDLLKNFGYVGIGMATYRGMSQGDERLNGHEHSGEFYSIVLVGGRDNHCDGEMVDTDKYD